MAVENKLNKLKIPIEKITLGEVILKEKLTPEQREQVENAINPLGFEIIDDRKSRIIQKIKTLIIELVHNQDNAIKTNLSDFLSKELHHDYNYLSNLFSEIEGTTIEKYFINQKIERVKELLVYDELTLSEIAFQLNYSSVSYLSNQFKKVTGLSPSHFKKIGQNRRKSLDEI
jgi:AraC-like DNA-binding protein